MGTNILYCKLPTGVISCLASVSNILMIIFIQCSNRLVGPMKTWATNLGCINTLLSSAICIRTFISIFSTEQRKFSNATEAVIMSFGSFLTIQQLASQLSISIERLLAVCRPFKYRLKYAKGDRKVLTAIIWLVSAVSGAVIGGFSVCFHIPVLVSISTWLFFAGALLTHILLYSFTIKEVKGTSGAVQDAMYRGTQQASNASKIAEVRRKQERKLHLLAIGITLSYTCCNFPITVFVGMYDLKMESQSCYTKEGLFYTLSLAFVCVNLLFDPFWYFCSYVLYK